MSILLSLCLYGENFTKQINAVIDVDKNIMWQDNSESMSHKENYTMAKVYCETLILNGYIDWRVPTIKELISLIDVKNKKAAILKEFQYTKNDIYYSSTQFVENSKIYWYIDFATGVVNHTHMKNEHYIRCVRDIK